MEGGALSCAGAEGALWACVAGPLCGRPAQADVVCLQETQDSTFNSTLVPALTGAYSPYQSVSATMVRSRTELTRSTFVR